MQKNERYKNSKQSMLDIDAQALVQNLRIFIWKMIAQNNAETLVDPLLEPIKEPMPYVQGVQQLVDDADAVKTLDEIMPLPDSKQPAQPEQATAPAPKKKKTSAKDLLADDSAQQITIDEAIKDTDAPKSSEPAPVIPAQEAKQPAQPEQATPAQTEEPPKSEEPAQLPILERFLNWRIERANRRDYFKALELQIKNKNSACYAILDYLDDLCEE